MKHENQTKIEYELPDEVNYSLKPEHIKRSIVHSPNHLKCKKSKV